MKWVLLIVLIVISGCVIKEEETNLLVNCIEENAKKVGFNQTYIMITNGTNVIKR